MAAQLPTCREAESNLTRILAELRSQGILKTPYQDTIALAFTRCASCRGRRTRCAGWRLSLTEATTIEFRTFEVKGRHVYARISGTFSTQRSHPARGLDNWRSQPCGISTCAIEILELPDSMLVERHHHDLAWSGQPGPVWHLQLGGASTDNRWLNVPRWPSAPMDPVLVIELAVYSFYNDNWNELRSSNPWRRIIKRSEDLLLPHYGERLQAYRSQADRADSWLAYQCNVKSDWNPRPNGNGSGST